MPPKRRVEPVVPSEELVQLGAALPEELHLGTSSWSFPGWAGIVYAREASERLLAQEGLGAYAEHPLMRAVGLDRTYYGPIDAVAFRRYADAVPSNFRFLVKGFGELLLSRFPNHPRYAERRGMENRSFLDPELATRDVVEPYVEGLGALGGVLLFQFPPQRVAGGPPSFVRRLREFLEALPRGPTYAVEVRNPEFVTRHYVEALRRTGTLHCLTAHPTMPPLLEQARLTGALDAPQLVMRWMLARQHDYRAAKDLYSPFDRLAEPDADTREQVVQLLTQHRGRRFLIVNNKAEGSSPLSIVEVAKRLVQLGA